MENRKRKTLINKGKTINLDQGYRMQTLARVKEGVNMNHWLLKKWTWTLALVKEGVNMNLDYKRRELEP